MNPLISQLMAKVAARAGRGGSTSSGSVNPSTLLAIAGVMNNLANKIAGFNQQNRGSNSPTPDTLMNNLFNQTRVASLINSGAISTASKFINENYQYVKTPSIAALGNAGGQYGGVLSSYLETKQSFTRGREEMGGNLAAAGVGALFMAKRARELRRGLSVMRTINNIRKAVLVARLGGAAATASVVGALPGAIAVAGSFAVEGVISLASYLIGRKIGNYTANVENKDGVSAADAAAGAAAGGMLFEQIPRLREMYTSNSLALTQTGRFDGEGVDMVGALTGISTRRVGGVSLRDLGANDLEDINASLGNVSRMNLDTSSRGFYVNQIGKYQATTGEDISQTIGSISSGLAQNESPGKGNTTKSIEFTAQLFDNFFSVATRDGVNTTKSAVSVAKSMAEMASAYSQRFVINKDAAKTVMQVQGFSQEALLKPGQNSTEPANDLLSILTSIGSSKLDSRLANELTASANISTMDTISGMNGDHLDSLMYEMSDRFNLGGVFDLAKDKSFVETGDKELTSATFANFINAATADKSSGGLQLNLDQAVKLAQALVAYQDNPTAFRNSKINSIGDLSSVVNKDLKTDVFRYNVLTSSSRVLNDLGNHYLYLSKSYIKDYLDMNNKMVEGLNASRLDILQGMTDIYQRLTEVGLADSPSGGTGGSGGSTGGTGGSGGVYPIYGSAWGTGSTNKTVLQTSGVKGALKSGKIDSAFIKEVEAVSSRLGVDPNWLMALMAHESYGTFETGSIKGSTAVGLIQFTNTGIAGLNQKYGTNLTKAQLSAMTQIQQLEWVEKFLLMQSRGRKISFAGDLYMLIFAPAGFGKADSEAVYVSGTEYYERNSSLDTNKDGRISAGEIRAVPFREGGIGQAYMEGVSSDLVEDFLGSPSGSTTVHRVNGSSAYVLDKNYSSQKAIGLGYDKYHYLPGSSRLALKGQGVKLGVMSGYATKTGLKTAEIMEQALRSRGANMGYSGTDFWVMCASVASKAVAMAGGTRTQGSSADLQLGEWFRRYPQAVLSQAQIAATGFQPGDMIWVINGNHVGIVAADGSFIQAGQLKDVTDGDYLVRTDLTTYEYEGSWVVARPSLVTGEQQFAITNSGGGSPTKSAISKPLKGSKFLVNSQNNRYTVKTVKGGSLTKGQTGNLKDLERRIEKSLGIKDADLDLGVNTQTGGRYLSIKINSGNLDPSKVAAAILKEVEATR